MLKGIPKIISPDLMKILLEMGHGDEIVLADGNFPAASCGAKLIRCEGHGVLEVLQAILQFFPLDTYSDHSVSLMKVVKGDPTTPSIWETYDAVIKQYDTHFDSFEMIDRFAFYERAKKAYAIVATSEIALYANMILKKGVVTD
ncbi:MULTISPECIES: RbsD/FucU family protein [Bacillus cereus group]|uniref:Ribose ABC transporter protein n=1 Tax=Bacillus thuringiensis TaxID=1428 RepID=A0A1C4EX87_BACTU|nr:MULTISPECIES: RbsD/FucU domain-containing protein [Bacillus cereus group]MED3025367.1 RbsD/FucU domain-containing protein [Bacillus wiedmannii]OTX98621.1 fucose isomerase [Bacillus thuringiensis serovar wratislaviensis]OUB58063.1 fucose isomerase [Bacillus thuringiensis serovar sylvestriensis]SCC48145.1 Ribose ABC transporter protein [Bacillus thuringiensis]